VGKSNDSYPAEITMTSTDLSVGSYQLNYEMGFTKRFLFGFHQKYGKQIFTCKFKGS